MPSALTAPSDELLHKAAMLERPPFDRGARTASLERFFSLRSGRERPGRFWRIDFETIAPSAGAIELDEGAVRIETAPDGVLTCDLATAAREYPELFSRAFGATGIANTKFGALAAAFAGVGAFIYLRSDRAYDEPIVIHWHAAAGTAIFPWNLVLAERGASATIVERITAEDDAFVCGAAEIVTEENADVNYAVLQRASANVRVITTRSARPGRDAIVSLAAAELGGQLAAGDLAVEFDHPGARANVTGIFFPRSSQHVDVVSTVEHRAGEATSETVVKSAASERGQARFLGNIRIAPGAQGSDARLRDDALLLSTTAHIDSVPALEIGANDVKAYHGATVGAIDADQIFYMESRGIDRSSAERMIALGFFEPAVERFPMASLRDEIRAALAEKLS